MNAPRLQRSAGMSLLEVLIALLVISLVLSFAISALLGNASLNDKSEVTSGAAAAVRRVLDRTRAADPSTLPSSGTSEPENVTVGNRTYTVYTDYCVQPEYCTASARSLRVRARLGASGDLVSTDTVFTSVSSQGSAGS
ncbi:hypothetical protein DKM44_08165 [Deinococcus irradiatisoli]|uniref:Prepilin-type cleavage/methylation domain-containing protein n=1 Tax=Deinococcus irradiatisoli TaxID=2202254 RepID=A0A2Z3JDT2_9DEIO|nr:prepilin-type N-terminal cleavage/methylation domain-containing protein [Deinococcus irradiatisoli]AWN23202.1 hypothetical protein DKM44_08165 [Deinococcus irradiatisoli]